MRSEVLILLLCVALVPACGTPLPPGVVEGHVTIGPLCPVEPCNVPASTVAAAYAARKIVIYDEANTPIQYVMIDSTGNYRAEVKPGLYVVDLKENGMDRADGLPKTIMIESGQTMRINVQIDTGIR